MNENDERLAKQESLAFEQEKFQFEKKKFKEQLKTERIRTIATALSIIIPVIVAGWTINSNLTLQSNQAKYDFSLKIADIAMSAKTPAGTEARAKALRDMFPDYVDDSFLRDFDAAEYSASDTMVIRERKERLLQLLVENGKLSSDEIVDWWKKLYPEDRWINETANYETTYQTAISLGEQEYPESLLVDEPLGERVYPKEGRVYSLPQSLPREERAYPTGE